MLYYDRTDLSEEIDLANVTAAKNLLFAIIGFLIMDSNFKILYAVVAII